MSSDEFNKYKESDASAFYQVDKNIKIEERPIYRGKSTYNSCLDKDYCAGRSSRIIVPKNPEVVAPVYQANRGIAKLEEIIPLPFENEDRHYQKKSRESQNDFPNYKRASKPQEIKLDSSQIVLENQYKVRCPERPDDVYVSPLDDYYSKRATIYKPRREVGE